MKTINIDRQAAEIIADLLASSIQRAIDTKRTFLYCWEKEGLDWLRDHWKRDQASVFNGWTAQWVVDSQRLLDLLKSKKGI